MPDPEWFYISQRKKRNEKAKSIRDVRASSVFFDDTAFTGSAIVPTVSVNDEEDDFGEEKE
jgi:hypothetical protein